MKTKNILIITVCVIVLIAFYFSPFYDNIVFKVLRSNLDRKAGFHVLLPEEDSKSLVLNSLIDVNDDKTISFIRSRKSNDVPALSIFEKAYSTPAGDHFEWKELSDLQSEGFVITPVSVGNISGNLLRYPGATEDDLRFTTGGVDVLIKLSSVQPSVSTQAILIAGANSLN